MSENLIFLQYGNILSNSWLTTVVKEIYNFTWLSELFCDEMGLIGVIYVQNFNIKFNETIYFCY
jgi:hypothetical protein